MVAYRRWTLPAMVAVLLLVPGPVAPASAKDLNIVLIASNVDFHVGSPTAASKPTIPVDPGDVLHLEIHNHDGMPHTFTLPHFGVDTPLAPGSDANPTIVFVVINTTTADNGRWQFYCAVLGHASGPDERRTGMVGWLQIGPAPPPTPGFEVVLLIAALGILGALGNVASHAARALRLRRK